MIKTKIKKIIIFIIMLNLFAYNISFAHPGRLDSNGGHWNRSTGTYHYHTGENSGQSSFTNSSKSNSLKTYEDKNISNAKSLNKQDKEFDVWTLVAIIFLSLFFGIPLVIDVVRFLNTKIKSHANKNIKKENNEKKIPTAQNIHTPTFQYVCPKCGHQLIVKNGKYGKFLGCSNYPYCKYTKSINSKKI